MTNAILIATPQPHSCEPVRTCLGMLPWSQPSGIHDPESFLFSLSIPTARYQGKIRWKWRGPERGPSFGQDSKFDESMRGYRRRGCGRRILLRLPFRRNRGVCPLSTIAENSKKSKIPYSSQMIKDPQRGREPILNPRRFHKVLPNL